MDIQKADKTENFSEFLNLVTKISLKFNKFETVHLIKEATSEKKLNLYLIFRFFLNEKIIQKDFENKYDKFIIKIPDNFISIIKNDPHNYLVILEYLFKNLSKFIKMKNT